jgi:hypothetical protein
MSKNKLEDKVDLDDRHCSTTVTRLKKAGIPAGGSHRAFILINDTDYAFNRFD